MFKPTHSISESSKDVNTSVPESDAIRIELQMILKNFISSQPGLSINGLSKKCNVSEATLRRIKSGANKNLPTLTTILQLLSYISQKQTVREVAAFFNGQIGDFILEKMPSHHNTMLLDHSIDLSNKLNDSVNYLIYKLAANKSGITLNKISELFGTYGLQKFEELWEENLLAEDGVSYHAVHKNFRLSHEVFVQHLQATANFIKPNKLSESPSKISQIFYNCSASLNVNAYKKILKIQRTATKKIRQVMFDPESQGNIPTFNIGAIDTLDHQSAFEISQQNDTKD